MRCSLCHKTYNPMDLYCASGRRGATSMCEEECLLLCGLCALYLRNDLNGLILTGEDERKYESIPDA